MNQRIADLLGSVDIEMVQLGVLLLSKEVDPVFWEHALSKYLHPLFGFVITDEGIIVESRVSTGIWQQMNASSYQHKFSPEEFSLDILKDTINNYLYGKDKGAT